MITLKTLPEATRMHRDLIMSLQYIHDCAEPKDWSIALGKIASRYSLKFTPWT